MRIVRFAVGRQARYGIVEETTVTEIQGDICGSYRLTRKRHPLSRIRFLPPTIPSKIVAVGVNYRDHAVEFQHDLPEDPVLFLKPTTALLPHKGKILYPAMASRVDYEAELAVVIKKTVQGIAASQALRYILGYTCFNDVTARDLQRKDGQWTRAKSFNTFAPCGPWIETSLDLSGAAIRSYLNGQVRQNSTIGNFIFDIPHLVSFVSQVMTLYPGDIIATGTPSGVGPMQPGDVVEVEIEGIGKLQNSVIRTS